MPAVAWRPASNRLIGGGAQRFPVRGGTVVAEGAARAVEGAADAMASAEGDDAFQRDQQWVVTARQEKKIDAEGGGARVRREGRLGRRKTGRLCRLYKFRKNEHKYS